MDITIEYLEEVQKALADALKKADEVNKGLEELRESMKEKIKEMDKRIKNLSELEENIKDKQNMPVIYYRKIDYSSSEDAYFWYGKDWADNNPQKVQKYYGKETEVFFVPNPIDKSDQFNYTPLHTKVENIIENHELISEYVWIDCTDVLLFPSKPNNAFTFDMFVEEMLKAGISFLPEPEEFRK